MCLDLNNKGFYMRHLLTGLVISCLLGACTSTESTSRSFNKMSDTEISDYNRTVPMLQQIVCQVERTTGSWVKKRECRTHADVIMGKRGDVGAINSANHGTAVISVN